MRRCLEDMKVNTRLLIFSFPVQTWVRSLRIQLQWNSPGVFICRFEQVGINAEKFLKTRNRLVTVTYLLPARHQYFLSTLYLWTGDYQFGTANSLMIEGGKDWKHVPRPPKLWETFHTPPPQPHYCLCQIGRLIFIGYINVKLHVFVHKKRSLQYLTCHH